MTTKRFIIACLMGILAGLVCVLISGGGKLPLKVIAHIFTSREKTGEKSIGQKKIAAKKTVVKKTSAKKTAAKKTARKK